MMATVRHVTSSSGLRKFPTVGFLSDRAVHIKLIKLRKFVCSQCLCMLFGTAEGKVPEI
jgi:hypothetical protein